MYWLKKTLVLWLSKRLMPIIVPEDSIGFTRNGDVYIGGKKAIALQLKNLKEEIKFLEESSLWKIINSHLNSVAEKRIVLESKDFHDVLIGKMILYTFDVQNKIIEKIKSLKT